MLFGFKNEAWKFKNLANFQAQEFLYRRNPNSNLNNFAKNMCIVCDTKLLCLWKSLSIQIIQFCLIIWRRLTYKIAEKNNGHVKMQYTSEIFQEIYSNNVSPRKKLLQAVPQLWDLCMFLQSNFTFWYWKTNVKHKFECIYSLHHLTLLRKSIYVCERVRKKEKF